MASMIAQEMPLENEDGSSLIPPLKFKRRKVSAVHEFSCGRGPNVAQISFPATVEGAVGAKEGVASKDVEACQEDGWHEADEGSLSGDFVEGQGHDVPIIRSGVQMEASRVAELWRLSVRNTDSVQEIQNVERRSLLRGEIHDSSDRKRPADVIKIKKQGEDTQAQQHLLPCHLIPSTIVSKEPKYPPPREISAVRGFPAGCGSTVKFSRTGDKQVVQGEIDADIKKASILNQNIGKLDGENVLEDKNQSGIDESAAARMLVVKVLFGINEQEKSSVDSEDDQRVKALEQSRSGAGKDRKDVETSLEELDKNLIVYGKDSLKKSKDSAGVSSSNIELQGEFEAGSGAHKVVVVQGLMSAASCPWTQGRGLTKSSPRKLLEQSGFGAGKDGKGMETSLEDVDKDLTLYGKDSLKRSKSSAGVFRSNIESQGEFGAGSGAHRGVVVQGLMSAASCSWTQGRGLAKSSPRKLMEQSGFGAGKDGKGMETSLEDVDKDLIFYGKDSLKKSKSSAGVSSSNIESAGEFGAVSGSHKGVVVQGLISAAFCPWTQVRGLAKSSPWKLMEQSGSGAAKDIKDMDTSLEELDKDLIIYGMDSLKKSKSSVGVSNSNIELPGEFRAGSGSHKGVVVQGLMSAASCPWTQKNGSNGQDKSKPSVNKGKRSAELSAEKSMMTVPDSKDTLLDSDSDVNGFNTPLAVRCYEDSSDNEEPGDFQFLPRTCEWDITLPPALACTSGDRGARSKVRETLRLFQVVVRKLLQGEETKSKEKGKAGQRVHMQAASVLRVNGRYINTVKVIGAVPGVEVGDIFSYRIELAIVGLHSPLQSGIDTMRLGEKSVAISVVASGGYDNDFDSSDVLIYTGQGGNPAGPDKQPEDQKLERGNLALKNSIDEKTPVRVIRGFREAKPADSTDARPKMITTYTYDGLYSAERYWHDLGSHGKMVYKFELRRIPGQHELAWKEVKQSRKQVRPGRCVDDISQGKEKPAICAINTIDGEQPPPFTYINNMLYPDWCTPIPPRGCDCEDGCSDSELCACAVKNGGEIPYNFSGAIVEAKTLVYECGPSCKCPPSCPNRVSQHGIKLPLEIFKTESMGWGVRCLSSISSGSFICEYLGELLDDKEAEQRTGSDEYLFDIGLNYNDPTLTDGLSAVMPDMASTASDIVENIGFTIDAAMCGNIGRFINHSCSPNLYAQNLLFDHEDKRIPHIMFFAAENIPPLQELTYHYNYTIDQVFDEQGKIKRKDCYCGSAECTGRMY